MKKSLIRKLISSIVAALFLVLTTVSATYAWFVTNTEAWVYDIGLDVTSGTGIYLSINGTGGKTTLTELDLMKAIIAKCGDNAENSEYYHIDSSSNLIRSVTDGGAGVILTDDEIKEVFDKIKMAPVTTLDGENFTEGYVDGNESIVNVTDGKYVQFDLYFTSNYSGSDDNHTVDVYFYDNNNSQAEVEGLNPTQITSDEKVSTAQTVSDTTSQSYANQYRLLTGLTTYSKTGDRAGSALNYASGSSGLVLKTADCVRFSTKTIDYNTSDTDAGVVNYNTKIYEPNLGLGSYATDLDSEKYKDLGTEYYLKACSFDATKNAAFTYTNNMRGKGSTEPYLSYNDLPTIYNDFSNEESALVCQIKGQSATRVTFTIWLEGWDADCFDGIIGDYLNVTLSFTSNYPSVSNTRTVEYNNEGVSTVYTYFNNRLPNLILPKEAEGKVFDGWYLGEERYDFTSLDSLTTSSVNTLTAKYKDE